MKLIYLYQNNRLDNLKILQTILIKSDINNIINVLYKVFLSKSNF